MSRQLDLFPQRFDDAGQSSNQDGYAELGIDLNAIDELFISDSRYRRSPKYIELLEFIARFPAYSAFNCFLMYTQNPSAAYVATARTWARRFGRRPKIHAKPMIILAPMAPVRFVFDIKDTEGRPAPGALLDSTAPKVKHPAKTYETTLHNCADQGISVYETPLDPGNMDTATRITPALRKKYSHLNLQKVSNYLIFIDEKDDSQDKYSSLAYELGHIFCGHLGIDTNAWWPERRGLNVSAEEIEAASVAFLVSRRHGLFGASAKYLADYTRTPLEMPFFSLNAVLQAANYIEKMGKSHWSKPKKRSRY